MNEPRDDRELSRALYNVIRALPYPAALSAVISIILIAGRHSGPSLVYYLPLMICVVVFLVCLSVLMAFIWLDGGRSAFAQSLGWIVCVLAFIYLCALMFAATQGPAAMIAMP